MAAGSAFYRDLAYVFVAALVGGLVARRLRQPLIVGYVLAGILIGPFTPGPTVSETHALELLAEIGVILLMFSIGIEFSVQDLLRVKWVALVGAPIGILLSIALGVGAGKLLGWTLAQGIVVGAVVSVASTMVLARLLADRGELGSERGRLMIGITLVEDLAVVILTILIPSAASLGASQLAGVALAIGKSLLLLVPVAFAAAKLVPPLLARVARTGSDELYLLVVLALGFTVAATSQALGLSLALGAFLAGVVVSGSDHAHQTLSRILPIRDAFVALFFVTIGALIDPRSLLSNPSTLLAMVLLVVVGKFAVWTVVVRAFRYPLATALFVGIGLTQIGEFSYVLVRVAREAGLIDAGIANATLAASLLTILINAFLMRAAPSWLDRGRRAAAIPSDAARRPRRDSPSCFSPSSIGRSRTLARSWRESPLGRAPRRRYESPGPSPRPIDRLPPVERDPGARLLRSLGRRKLSRARVREAEPPDPKLTSLNYVSWIAWQETPGTSHLPTTGAPRSGKAGWTWPSSRSSGTGSSTAWRSCVGWRPNPI
jgi:monovalent cation:H+ antiporter-2, CPA2 family